MIDFTFCPFPSGQLCTFLWSTIPFLELRAAIPLGYLKFGLSLPQTIIAASLGGIITAAIVLKLLPHLIHFFEKHSPLFDRLMKKIIKRTRKKNSQKMALFGELFLILFVAIPFPGSGAWSGVLLAYLFGIPYKKAIVLVSIGVILSAILISSLTLFGQHLWIFFDKDANYISEFVLALFA